MNISADRKRALTTKAQQYAANIGDAAPYLLSRGISVEAAAMFSLGLAPHGTEFAGRLSIPYVTPTGVVGIKYRCADLQHADHKDAATACPKYLYEPGCGMHLFNAQVLITAADMVVITEGELDAVTVQAYCGIPAVAYPGTETWRKQSHYPLCFEGVAEVIVIADGDPAGKRAANEVAESIGGKARVVQMPPGDDSNSFITSQGASAFTERIR